MSIKCDRIIIKSNQNTLYFNRTDQKDHSRFSNARSNARQESSRDSGRRVVMLEGKSISNFRKVKQEATIQKEDQPAAM
jgi:hypothetical protein